MTEPPRVDLNAGNSGAPAGGGTAADRDRPRRDPDADAVETFRREMRAGPAGEGATPPVGGPPLPRPSILQDEAWTAPGATPGAPPFGTAGSAIDLRGTAERGDGQGGEQGASGHQEDSGSSGPSDAPVPTPFDLFRSGTLATPTEAGRPAVTEPPAAGDPSRLEAIARIVERMTVSDGAAGGDREVRIALKSDVLPGAEVRIAERAGELQVEFVTTDPASEAWLSAQSEQMATHLAERLRRDVRVRVRPLDADGNTGGGDLARRPAEPPAAGPAGSGARAGSDPA